MFALVSILLFLQLTSSASLGELKAALLERNKNSPQELFGMPMDFTTATKLLEELGWTSITIPEDVKESVDLPHWLSLWENAGFASGSGIIGLPLGSDTDDMEVKAAAYLASMTGGVWMSNSDAIHEREDIDLEATLLSYLRTGDQSLLTELQVIAYQ